MKIFESAFKNFLAPRQQNLIDILERKVAEGFFTHWSFGCKHLQVSRYFLNDEEIFLTLPNLHPWFDLASLTKPFFLNLSLRLCGGEEDFLRLILDPLNKYPSLCLNDFLSHTSGLKPWTWLGRLGQGCERFPSTREQFVAELRDLIFNSSPNFADQSTRYSDLNYIVLPLLCEEGIWGQKMFGGVFSPETSWQNLLAGLNAHLGTSFKHSVFEQGAALKPYSMVHDLNAQIFAERSNFYAPIPCAHAGFWGTLSDVLTAASFLAQSQERLLSFSTFRKKNTQRFLWGLDTPTGPDSTAGLQDFAAHQPFVFGHLGYTGTSFWMHTSLQQVQGLLTDRTKTPCLGAVQDPAEPTIIVVSTQGQEALFFKQAAGYQHLDFAHWQELWQNRKARSFLQKDCVRLPPVMSDVRTQTGHALWDFP